MGRSVLIIDSRAETLDESARLVRAAGSAAVTATSSSVALDVAQRETPAVVLLDEGLEDDGLQLLRTLQKSPACASACLALTINSELSPSELSAWRAAGVVEVFWRPLRAQEFELRLQRLMRLQHAEAALKQPADAGRRVTEPDLARAYEEAQEVAKIGSWEYDVATGVHRWSKQMLRIAGLDPTTAEPPTWEQHRDFVHPEDWGEVRRAFEQALLGQPYAGEYRVRQLDGSYHWVHSLSRTVVDEEGAPLRIQGTTQDIQERKEMEEELRSSEQRFRALFQEVPISLWEEDLSGVYDYLTGQGRTPGEDLEEYFEQHPEAVEECGRRVVVTAVNDASAELHRASSPEQLVTRLPETFTERSWEAFRAHLVAVWRGDTSWRGEVELQTLDGQLLHAVIQSSVPMQYQQRMARIFVSITDVTEKTSLEAQLRQAQKMESIGRLAGGVAHDFNNLLTVILSSAEMVLEDLDPGDPACTDLEQIVEAGQRANDLTQQLLTFSRKQVVAPQVIDLNAELQNATVVLRRLIGEDIELQLVLADDLAAAHLDRGQLNQVLLNLVVNARDAMPEGGRLVLQTRNASPSREGSGQQPREPTHVLLAVSDSGHGMAGDVLSQVFEPFFTTKPMTRGTGLGLSTVHGIVKQAGGFVDVDSQPGQGTTFRVFFPTTTRAREPAPPTESEPPQTLAPATTATILLIEDEDAVRRAALKILEKAGYVAFAATTPHEALRLAQEHGASLDLVLTDIVMPEMSGTLCYERLQERIPGIKVLFMSGYAPEDIAARDALEGKPFIQKPFSVSSLQKAVGRVLTEK